MRGWRGLGICHPPTAGSPGPSWELWGTRDRAGWGKAPSVTSHFDNCIIFQCEGGLFYRTIAWGGWEPNLLLGEGGLVLGPGLPLGAGVTDDYM